MELSLYSILSLGAIAVGLIVAYSRRLPATATLLITNIVVFILTEMSPTIARPLGAPTDFFEPVSAVHGELALYTPNLLSNLPWSYVQVFSSMFVHGDLLHLLGNSLFLAFFGFPFEQRIGGQRFVAIYILTGICAVVAELAILGDDPALMMGASGAIFGILGAFAARFPRQIVPVPIPLPIMFIVRMPIYLGAAMFLAFQLFYAYYTFEFGSDGVAYFAHIGGLLGGIALAPLLVPRNERSSRERVDLTKFAPFARNEQAKRILEAMQKNHDEPAVFQAWLDRFLKVAECPACGKNVKPAAQGHVVCADGHHFDLRMA